MTKSLFATLLILVMVGGLTAVNSTKAQSSTEISGYILDSNGNGLSGADIIFGVPTIVPSILSNGSGYYQIYAPPGTYHLTFGPHSTQTTFTTTNPHLA